MDKNYVRVLWVTICFLLCPNWESLSKGNSLVTNEFRIEHYGDRYDVFAEEARGRELSDTRDNSGWSRSGNESRYDHVYELERRINSDRSSEGTVRKDSSKKGLTGNISVHGRTELPRISKYISYHEATYSPTARKLGIKNDPNDKQLELLVNLGVNFFDVIRAHFGKPLYISSFFRNKELNSKVGGAVYSDHMALDDAAGIDIDMDGKGGPTNNQVFHYILGNMQYFKLIAEFPANGKLKWIHASYSTKESQNKERNTYIAQMRGTRKVYIPYKGNERLVSLR